MDQSATLPELPPAPDAGDEAARAEWRTQLLRRLVEVGVELAEAIGRNGLGIGPGMPRGAALGAATAFDRIARAVRMTLALQARLHADPMLRAWRPVRRPAGAAAAQAGAEAAKREAKPAAAVKLGERLSDPSIEAELGDRPFGVVVQDICRGLGVACDAEQFNDAEMGVADAPAAHGSAADGAVAPAEAEPAPRPRDSGPPARAAAAGAGRTTSSAQSWAQTRAVRRAWRRMGVGRDPPRGAPGAGEGAG